MKKAYTLFLSLSGLLQLQAQVILTEQDVPATGTRIVNYDAKVPSPAFIFSKTGDNNTWDFATISPVPTKEATVTYLDPAATPGGIYFPNATIANRGTDGIYNYGKVETSAIFIIGFYGDFTGAGKSITIPLDQPVPIFPFPYTASTDYSGSILVQKKIKASDVGIPLADSAWLYRRQIGSIKVVATGDIVLPSGTHPAILEENISTTVDSTKVRLFGIWNFVPNSPKITTDTTYKWYINGSVEPAAFVVYEKGKIIDVQFRKVDEPLSLLNQHLVPNSISCYPNPTTEYIQFGIPSEQIQYVNILTVDGKEVVSIKEFSGPTVSLKELETGIYHVKIVLKNGIISTSRFVKL